jgi:uncharacterized LabA/DUF88 family protein
LSYPAEERPVVTGGAEHEPEPSESPDDTDVSRTTRPPRRRRGRRLTPADTTEAGDEAGETPAAADVADENSVIDVEPDLLAAQEVESVGVGTVETAAAPPGDNGRRTGPIEQDVPPSQPAVTSRSPGPVSSGGGQVRQRQGGFVQGQQPSRGQQGGQRPAQSRAPRVQPLPPGVPSAAALDELDSVRTAPPARTEPQGDLAVLLRGFEEIQQRNTDRILAALRQTGGNDGAPSRTASAAERVGVFVDVPNLVYAARYLNRWIDFGRLLDRLLSGRRLIRAHAYSPTDPDPSADQQFLTPVKAQGYRLTTKNYRTFASGAKKADMDLDLCMDVVRLVVAKAVECIVLCSGDGDFLPLLDFCADNGVRVEVASFVEATSDELRQACDRFYNLSAMEGIRLSRPLGATN